MSGSDKAILDEGDIYILSNPSMPHSYKIGLTRISIESRVKSLRSTSLPTDFKCIYSIKSDNALQLEKYIHRTLKGKRINSKREFFNFQTDEMAITQVSQIASKFKPRAYTEKEKVKLGRELKSNTASGKAKQFGLKGLLEVSRITNTSPQTLNNWFNDKPELFEVVLLGCVKKLENDKESTK